MLTYYIYIFNIIYSICLHTYLEILLRRQKILMNVQYFLSTTLLQVDVSLVFFFSIPLYDFAACHNHLFSKNHRGLIPRSMATAVIYG